MALSTLKRNENWVDINGKPTDRFASVVEALIKEVDEMSVNKQLFITRPSTTSATPVYTAPSSAQGGRGTVIKQFVATDPASAATFNVYIGSAASATTKVVSSETAANDGTRVVSLYDALVSPGESVFVECSAGNVIVFFASGTERRN